MLPEVIEGKSAENWCPFRTKPGHRTLLHILKSVSLHITRPKLVFWKSPQNQTAHYKNPLSITITLTCINSNSSALKSSTFHRNFTYHFAKLFWFFILTVVLIYSCIHILVCRHVYKGRKEHTTWYNFSYGSLHLINLLNGSFSWNDGEIYIGFTADICEMKNNWTLNI